jgi:methylmalonyl-CoA mutase cobalamin-binding subunit
MTKKILGAALGDCVHIGGVTRFLGLAQELGYRTEFTGPATSVRALIAAAQEVDPDIIGVSYRLTPENAVLLLRDFKRALEEAGLAHKRLVFGGTPPVAEVARQTGMFEAVFDGRDPPAAVLAYLKGTPLDGMKPQDYPQDIMQRIGWKAPLPILRHHFGVPAEDITPTVEGIQQIAEARVLDVISLGSDQDAQENFFHPERQDPQAKGAGGVPFRTEEDLERLYQASRRGNYPLLRSYSGTTDHIRYAEVLQRTIRNAWCATSLFWFNAMDGRGPSPMEQSIREHIELMRWHGARNIPVEGNEPYHWGLRDAHDVVVCAAAYIYAHVAKKAGVKDYISPYMFETPPHLSHKMDLAKTLAQIELAESHADDTFRIWRHARAGLLSYPVDADYARAQLVQSVYVQMAIRPAIVHVVCYSEADHAASAQEVIESCKMAHWVMRTCLKGVPDMSADPEVQRRKDQLIEETLELINAIRELGAGRVEDPLCDPASLAYAIRIGILDAPQLKNNPYVPGQVKTRAIDGAIVAVDKAGNILTEKERIRRVLAQAEARAATDGASR